MFSWHQMHIWFFSLGGKDLAQAILVTLRFPASELHWVAAVIRNQGADSMCAGSEVSWSGEMAFWEKLQNGRTAVAITRHSSLVTRSSLGLRENGDCSDATLRVGIWGNHRDMVKYVCRLCRPFSAVDKTYRCTSVNIRIYLYVYLYTESTCSISSWTSKSLEESVKASQHPGFAK